MFLKPERLPWEWHSRTETWRRLRFVTIFLLSAFVSWYKNFNFMHGVNNIKITTSICGFSQITHENSWTLWGGADKSLARPVRKQATATKLGIYSTYSPRSSIHFLARFSNFCKPLKKNSECCPSNQVSAAAMTSASEEKWRPFNCFFFSQGNRW